VLSTNTAYPVIAYGQITTSVATESETSINETAKAFSEEKIVRSYFKDLPIMVQIARCESSFIHTMSDGSVLRGRVDNDDIGIMQINRRYHEENADRLKLDLNNIYDNMTYARILYNESGTRPWNSSAPCWQKSLAKV